MVTKDARSWFDDIAATHSESASWALSRRCRRPGRGRRSACARAPCGRGRIRRRSWTRGAERAGASCAFGWTGRSAKRCASASQRWRNFVNVGPDEPAAHGRIMVVRADGPGSATLGRLMAVERGRSVLRAANLGWPDMEVSRANETMLRAVAMFVGRAV